MLKLKSLNLKYLKKKEIIKICNLKNTHWKFGLKSNLKWFRKNIKKKDIHNLLYKNEDLIGYTLLRKRLALLKGNKIKKIHYLYFDTLIIKDKFRKFGYSKALMNFNKKIIKKEKLHAFLICYNNLIKYYKKFGWTKIQNKSFKVMDFKFFTNGMTFNLKLNLKKIQIQYYFFKQL